MLPEELVEDLRRIGLRVQKFTIDRVAGGQRVARLVLRAQRGDLSAEDRQIAHEITSFNLPEEDIRFSPLTSAPSKNMLLFWAV